MTNKNEQGLNERYEEDREVWDSCAELYEQSIVDGHPDVKAYEDFEEDFLDRILLHIIRDHGKSVSLIDLGCGSARLHVHYGLKTTDENSLEPESAKLISATRARHPRHRYNPDLDKGLKRIKGIDFSNEMIQLAAKKIAQAGLSQAGGGRLALRTGSAFDIEKQDSRPLPVVVSVCNSIGVMQRHKGAEALFKAMARAVSDDGIAIISSYRKDAVATHALSNYESTMDVSGQPRWLEPDTWSSENFTIKTHYMKRAYDPSRVIHADIMDNQGKTIENDVEFSRIAPEVERTVHSGEIRFYSDYSSNWYSVGQFEKWIKELWQEGNTWHLLGNEIDSIRARPVQLAILDKGDHLADLFDNAIFPNINA